MSIAINKRLLVCASLVRREAVFADIGTDHGYLPIYLLENGIIDKAYLTDVNEGPLEKARENVKRANFSEKTVLKLCDGAYSLDGCGITDYAICGMGGELIADIIDASAHLKDERINLVLQPMSKPDALRKYLFDNGYDIKKELYVTDEGKRYVCMLASFLGENEPYSDADVYFGREDTFYEAVSEDLFSYMNEKVSSLGKIIKGKSEGGVCSENEQKLLLALTERLKNIKGDAL